MKPYPGAKLVVRMARYGCTNRPFYQIVVTWNRYPRDRKIKEQLGFYDRLPNLTGEQVLGLNLDRIRHHFKHSTEFTRPVLQLLGMTETYYWLWWKLDTCNQSYFKYSTEFAHALLQLFGKIHYICSFHVWIPAGFHFISLHISITCIWTSTVFCLIFMLKLSNKYQDNYAYSIMCHAFNKQSHTGLCYI